MEKKTAFWDYDGDSFFGIYMVRCSNCGRMAVDRIMYKGGRPHLDDLCRCGCRMIGINSNGRFYELNGDPMKGVANGETNKILQQ